jgi:hypothetical protein
MKEAKNIIAISIIIFSSIVARGQYTGMPILAHQFKPIFTYVFHDSLNKKPILYRPIFINSLPFFCKWEEISAKSTKINIKFRLGSLEYVDRLENK